MRDSSSAKSLWISSAVHRLHDNVRQLAVQLLAQHRRIPVKIARKLSPPCRAVSNHARAIAQHGRQLGGMINVHRNRPHRTSRPMRRLRAPPRASPTIVAPGLAFRDAPRHETLSASSGCVKSAYAQFAQHRAFHHAAHVRTPRHFLRRNLNLPAMAIGVRDGRAVNHAIQPRPQSVAHAHRTRLAGRVHRVTRQGRTLAVSCTPGAPCAIPRASWDRFRVSRRWSRASAARRVSYSRSARRKEQGKRWPTSAP